MKPKLLLALAVVWSGSFALSHADVTTTIASTNSVQPLRPRVLNFMDVLRETGTKLGCHFTLEYQGFGITGKETKATLPVRVDLSADSIPSLISRLRDYLDGFMVEEDAKNLKIVHIIEKVLADDKNYALNKRISLNYFGRLAPTNIPIPAKPGYETTTGGLLAAVAEKAGDIRGGSDDVGINNFLGMVSDRGTRINVNATNETVRSILTDCLPAANYSPVMWRAVTTTQNGESCVLVQFFGQKSTGNDFDQDLVRQIPAILTECQTIKPGMTRAELLKVFTTEGGLWTGKHRTFVYHRCPYIKVHVDFTLSDPNQNVLEERPTDTISNISKPYLDWGVID